MTRVQIDRLGFPVPRSTFFGEADRYEKYDVSVRPGIHIQIVFDRDRAETVGTTSRAYTTDRRARTSA
jgi:hypothetical protein